MNPTDEHIVIEKLKAGDNLAYKYLYDHYYVALCRFSYFFVKDSQLAESLVSDVIFHLWEVRENLELTPPLRSYLLAAVRNRCLNYLALKRQEMEIHFSTVEQSGIRLQETLADDLQPMGVLLGEELEHELQAAIARLPPTMRQVFCMSRFEEKTYEEISQILNISTNTVKYHIKSALAILREQFKKYLLFFSMIFPTLPL